MPIQFNCTQCGRKLQAPDNAVGRRAKCPDCNAILTVPGEVVDAEAVEASPEALNVAEPAQATYGVAQEPARDEAGGENRRPCPMCGELIPATAAKCRFCGEVFDPALRRTEEKKRRSGSAGDSDLSTGDWLLAILCSGIGCIMGIVWMIQGKPKGTKMFGVSFLFVIIWNIVRFVIEAGLRGGRGF